MRIVYLGNNLTGLNVLRWLVEQNESIVGLGVHPDERAKHKKEMIAVSSLASTQIFDGSDINQLLCGITFFKVNTINYSNIFCTMIGTLQGLLHPLEGTMLYIWPHLLK